jgi:hypothetical protein
MNYNHDTGTIDTIQIIDPTATPPLGGTAGVLTIFGTGNLNLPVGNTAQRVGTTNGSIRANTQLNVIEAYINAAWTDLTKQGTVTSVGASGSTGLTIGSSPVTTSGTITFTLGTELQALSGLSANGLITRTAANTYSSRTITGTASNISVSNGDGVSGNPTIDLVNAGSAVTAQFVKITTDAKGRVTATTSVVAGDITALVDSTYVNVTGDSVSGNITMTSGATITGLPAPSGSSDAAPKSYVDAAVTGLSWKASVRAGTTANITLSGTQTIDGVVLIATDRVLVKNQTTGSQNGIYVVAAGGWTRASDADTASELVAATVFISEGTTLADTGWVQTVNAPITVDTTTITFVQFNGSGTYVAGTGITLTGNTFSLTSPVVTTLGGTGLTSVGSANQVLGVVNGGSTLEYKTVTAGTGMNVTHGANAITLNNTGVTSVALSAPAIFSVSGSPVTTTGTLTFSLANQTQGLVFASPASSTAAPTFRALVASDLAFVSLYRETASSPTTPVASGNNAVAIGSASSATANSTFAVGAGTSASILGVQAYANGMFATAGDAQFMQVLMRNSTTNATITELFIDGSATRLVLPNNSSWTFTILLSARRTDATGGSSGYKFEGVIRKDTTSASATFTGTPSKAILGETNAAWEADVVADTTNGALKINVTGEAAKTIRWVANCSICQTTN